MGNEKKIYCQPQCGKDLNNFPPMLVFSYMKVAYRGIYLDRANMCRLTHERVPGDDKYYLGWIKVDTKTLFREHTAESHIKSASHIFKNKRK